MSSAKDDLLANADPVLVKQYQTEIIEVNKVLVQDMLEENRSEAGAILAGLYLAAKTMFKSIELAVTGVTELTAKRKEEMN